MEPQILILEDHDGGDWALCRVAYFDEVIAQRDDLLAALKGVVRVANRKTTEFNAAREAIAKVEGVGGRAGHESSCELVCYPNWIPWADGRKPECTCGKATL